MISILCWMVFGLFVGIFAKALHPGDDEAEGFLPTVGIGIAGSFIGGVIQWLMGLGSSPFEPSGFLFSIVGGVVFCWLYRMWQNAPVDPPSGNSE